VELHIEITLAVFDKLCQVSRQVYNFNNPEHADNNYYDYFQARFDLGDNSSAGPPNRCTGAGPGDGRRLYRAVVPNREEAKMRSIKGVLLNTSFTDFTSPSLGLLAGLAADE